MDHIRIQVKEELNINIDPLHIYINILSLCIFPILARPLIEQVFSLSAAQTEKFYADRKAMLPEFILNALKGYENKINDND